MAGESPWRSGGLYPFDGKAQPHDFEDGRQATEPRGFRIETRRGIAEPGSSWLFRRRFARHQKLWPSGARRSAVLPVRRLRECCSAIPAHKWGLPETARPWLHRVTCLSSLSPSLPVPPVFAGAGSICILRPLSPPQSSKTAWLPATA